MVGRFEMLTQGVAANRHAMLDDQLGLAQAQPIAFDGKRRGRKPGFLPPSHAEGG
jgi:hypothetical protein